jgi:outer membrane protein
MIKITQALLLISAIFLSQIARADEVTFGLGAFHVSVPHYPGANEKRSYTLPLPYFKIEKEHYKLDRNQFEGFVEVVDNHYLTLSLSGAIAVDSDKNKARNGMKDLGWIGEVGPSYQVYAWGDPHADDYMFVSPFVRKAYAVNSSKIDDIGIVYGGQIELGKTLYEDGADSLTLSSRLTTLWASESYHDYFYQITPSYVTPSRAFYDATSGYLSTSVSVGLSYETKKLWLGGFIRYADFSQSANQQSPLHLSDDNVSFGFGGAWKFYSKTN